MKCASVLQTTPYAKGYVLSAFTDLICGASGRLTALNVYSNLQSYNACFASIRGSVGCDNFVSTTALGSMM